MEKLKQAIVVYIYTKDLEGKRNPVHSRMTENMQSLHTLSNFLKSYFVWQQFINSLHLKVVYLKRIERKGERAQNSCSMSRNNPESLPSLEKL